MKCFVAFFNWLILSHGNIPLKFFVFCMNDLPASSVLSLKLEVEMKIIKNEGDLYE